MRLVELQATNFKRLHAVRISPESSLTQITGRNAQGKSSVLDAVQAALGGKDLAPQRPIRDGQTSAEVVLDLGDILVTRRWTANDRSSLVVESKEGARYNSPQAMLDKLLGELSFDPLAFSRMDEKAQSSTLRRLAKVDTSLIETKRNNAFQARTDVNREAKALEAQLASMHLMVADRNQEISVAEIAAKHQEALKLKAKNDKIRAAAEDAKKEAVIARECVRRDQDAINDKIKSIEELRNLLVMTERDAIAMEERVLKATSIVAALVDPNIADLAAEVKRAEAVNAAVRNNAARALKASAANIKQAEAAILTEQIDQLESEKSAALAAAKFPIEGLSLDCDTVTFKGVPLSQASSAEQLRIGLAMGAALNPKLRVVLVRDGSLLDADGMKTVADWAEREDMQVLMERVADGRSVGVVIEDGEVVGAAKAEPVIDENPETTTGEMFS